MTFSSKSLINRGVVYFDVSNMIQCMNQQILYFQNHIFCINRATLSGVLDLLSSAISEFPEVTRRSCRYVVLSIIAAFCSSTFAQSSRGLPPVERTAPNSVRQAPQVRVGSAKYSYSSKPQNFVVLEQQISFTNPSGYCTPGDSSKEKELVAAARQMLGNAVRLVHVAVKCDELSAYRNSERETLDHWMQIQLISAAGEFKRMEIPRETFLIGLSKSAPKLDIAELENRINSRLSEVDVRMSNLNLNQIGRDGNAYYMATRSTVKFGNESKVARGLGGVTLINSIPLAVWIYESSGTPNSRDQLQITLREAFVSLTSEN